MIRAGSLPPQRRLDLSHSTDAFVARSVPLSVNRRTHCAAGALDQPIRQNAVGGSPRNRVSRLELTFVAAQDRTLHSPRYTPKAHLCFIPRS